MTAELLDFPEIDETELTASICRESFADFVKIFWFCVPGASDLQWNWHLDVLCDEMQSVAERVFRGEKKQYDLVINVPPGTSKSTICSILFPAWVWTRFPQARVLTASHTDALVLDLASKSRQVIRSELYQSCFPDVELHADQGAKEYYRNTAGGDRKTCTVAGKSPIGFHGHFLIVDDPIDPKKVLSEAETRTAREFMTNVIPTRKVNKSVSVTILIMQRLGVGDPTDVMVDESKKEGAAKVRRVCLPAEQDESVEPAEFAGYYVDGLLDPERMGWDVIREFRARGEHFYQTQFLQRPFVKGGGLFKETYFNQRVKAAPYHAKRIRYWDRAATEGGGCATAGTLLAFDGSDWFIEHCEHGHWEPTERNERMRAVALRDRTRYGPNDEPTIWVEREGGSSGRDAWKGVARALAGFPVREDHVTGKKESRAEPWSCQLAAKNVYVVDDGCLIAGTKVDTQRGVVSIEHVERGDFVRTRRGWAEVARAWQTKTVDELAVVLFDDGSIVVGTRNHLIWTNNRGWIRLDDCTWNDTMIGVNHCSSGERSWENADRDLKLIQKQLCSVGSSITSEKEHRTTIATSAVFCTGRFGNLFTDRSPMAMKFITRMGIRSITKSGISTVLPGDGIAAFMRLPKSKRTTWSVLDRLLSRGREPLPVGKRAAKRVKRTGENVNQFGIGVSSVGTSSNRKEQWSDSAPCDVWISGITMQELTVRNVSASSAVSCVARQTSTLSAVQGSVGENCVDDGVPVFDLSVADDHEFFANGILVHNSWDVQGYIAEHVAFPNGPLKDRVDSSSGAFNLLSGRKKTFGLRTYTFAGPDAKKHPLRLIACTYADLPAVSVEGRALLVAFADPGEPTSLEHSLPGLLDRSIISFVDLDPAEHQETWTQPLGNGQGTRTAEEVMLTPDLGKQLWRFLLRKRPDLPQLMVFVDNGDRRALSAALAVASTYSPAPPLLTLGEQGLGECKIRVAPNRHVYDVLRATRGAVV